MQREPSSFKKLAAIDILFLSYGVVVAEYLCGILLSITLGLFVLIRNRSMWQVALGLYLICLGINYVPMLLHTFSIGSRESARTMLGDELTEPRKAMTKYRKLSLFLLVPLAVPIAEMRSRA